MRPSPTNRAGRTPRRPAGRARAKMALVPRRPAGRARATAGRTPRRPAGRARAKMALVPRRPAGRARAREDGPRATAPAKMALVPPTMYAALVAVWSVMMLPASVLALHSRVRGWAVMRRVPRRVPNQSLSRAAGAGDAGDGKVPRCRGPRRLAGAASAACRPPPSGPDAPSRIGCRLRGGYGWAGSQHGWGRLAARLESACPALVRERIQADRAPLDPPRERDREGRLRRARPSGSCRRKAIRPFRAGLLPPISCSSTLALRSPRRVVGRTGLEGLCRARRVCAAPGGSVPCRRARWSPCPVVASSLAFAAGYPERTAPTSTSPRLALD